MACGSIVLAVIIWTTLQFGSQFSMSSIDTDALRIPVAFQSYVNTYAGWATLNSKRSGRGLLAHLPELDAEDLNSAASFGEGVVSRMARLETNLADAVITVQPGTPAHGQLINSNPVPEALEQGKRALIAVKASLYLAQHHCQRFGLNEDQCARFVMGLKLNSTSLLNRYTLSSTCDRAFSLYRTADGSCNNPAHPEWGRSLSPYLRLLPSMYADGIHQPRKPVRERALPSARKVSVSVAHDEDLPDAEKTLALMQWSQFVEHDMAHTASTMMISTGESINCCRDDGSNLSPRHIHPACMSISIPTDDAFYARFRVRCMNYVRSMLAMRTDYKFGPAEQMNQATHFLDGSMIYGSTPAQASSLRKFSGGKLLGQENENGKELLPASENPQMDCQLSSNKSSCYRSGDKRVNTHPHLTAMHIIWLREHNRVALKLAEVNPHWNDELLYQEARRIVVAEIQHLTYGEWLPAVLGSKHSKKLGLQVKRSGFSDSFSASVNPAVSNSFATAALRFVHSMMEANLELYPENRTVNTVLRLQDHYQHPDVVNEAGQLDSLLRGMATQSCQRSDTDYADDLTSMLYHNCAPHGLDIVSLDIQRGRDHGLPGYNHFRKMCGLPVATSFEGFLDVIPPLMVQKLKNLYNHPDDVDLLVGGMAENPSDDGVLGFTFRCIVGEQFGRTKMGDRYFYDVGHQPHSFTEGQLQEIRKASLARVFCDNGDNIEMMQPNVFQKLSENNRLALCSDRTKIPRVNLDFWRDVRVQRI